MFGRIKLTKKLTLILLSTITVVIAFSLIIILENPFQREAEEKDEKFINEINSLLTTGIDLSDKNAVEIRAFIQQNNINSFVTASKNNLVAYNQNQNSFELININEIKNFEINDQFVEPEAFLNNYIIISNGGDPLSEAIYGIRNAGTVSVAEMQKHFDSIYKLKIPSLTSGFIDLINNTLFVNGEGESRVFTVDSVNGEFKVMEGEISKASKILYGDNTTSIQNTTFKGLTKINVISLPRSVNFISISAFESFSEGLRLYVVDASKINNLDKLSMIETLEIVDLSINKTVKVINNIVIFDEIEEIATFSELFSLLNSQHLPAKIIITSNMTFTNNLTIPCGVEVLIPFAEDDVLGRGDGTLENSQSRIASGDKLYLDIIINPKVTLSIKGKLTLGGIISHPKTESYQGHTSGSYSRILNNGTILVENQGILDIWGFVQGSGKIEAFSGSEVYHPFIVTDFVGGSNSLSLYLNGQSPFTRYSVMNIQCELIINYQALLYAHCNLYALSQYNLTDAVMIGYQAEESVLGLIMLAKDAYAVINYNPNKTVYDSNYSNNLEIDLGQSLVKIYGGAKTSAMSLILYGVNVTTSQVLFPVCYNFAFELYDGDYYFYNSYALLPGSSLVVDETASLTVTEGAEFYVLDGLTHSALSGKTYPTAQQLQAENHYSGSAEFIVNGTFNIKAKACFGGIIQTNSTSAIINIDKEAIISFDEFSLQLGTLAFSDANTSLYTLNGRIFDSESKEIVYLLADSTYQASSKEEWILPSYKVKYLVLANENDFDEKLDTGTTIKYYKYQVLEVNINSKMKGSFRKIQ